jgi:hypothetical protein
VAPVTTIDMMVIPSFRACLAPLSRFVRGGMELTVACTLSVGK